MAIEYEWRFGAWVLANATLLEECAALYSNHYGHWAKDAPHHAGQPVRLSSSRVAEWLKSPDAQIALATDDGRVVGYAIVVRAKVPRYGIVSWVTQLVVHERYRKRGVAKTLLFSLWGFSNHFAWGVVSANPYAVRALEKATRRRCSPERIAKTKRKLLKVADTHVPYISKDIETHIRADGSRINTGFFVDHSNVNEMIASISSNGRPWVLGGLMPGWEWLAFTFADQSQISLTPEEITAMLGASDQIVCQAYARMTLDASHPWLRHTDSEARQIVSYCNLSPESTVLDLGCGAGRHAIALGQLGVHVTGVDYVPEFILRGQKEAQTKELVGLEFLHDDCRSINLDRRFDSVICLYDVIGSFIDLAENEKILERIAAHLVPRGYALVSVMNRVLTESRAKHHFSLTSSPDRLLSLRPSRTMETTGDIFNPDYYMIDTDSGAVYRKEQFESGTDLPAELIVRDRRFSPDEIAGMCTAVGLDVVWLRCVRTGEWDTPLDSNDPHAKEILVLCQKTL